ncbi:MAG: hypothetical protein A4E70_00120 [Syntrophus sp. PtaU1.Bin005]|jgi:hypothetical protein|uniref:hypothetical protein n=1 Tax=Syntrophus TaxID=43773 RepID=UPI0009D5B125|nr:MAG: hypothetical protein A4E69_02347 [Syntrophus sp. PtaB.Bin138]OPY83610.1 MAG: hypothetical protein A4E70_00120 [Syntrophus sp. PtaU1.Bin005]
MILLTKTPENVLQEELLREKAEVLSRAGERVSSILQQLQDMEEDIEGSLRFLTGDCSEGSVNVALSPDAVMPEPLMIEKINEKILQFNALREEAKLRYHYLIITREALGMRKHHWVEAIYKIPARKGYMHGR